ncbi:hypothetical protein AMECASPLE_003090 [Ameca splendens]|uniref:Uncharacterized protein n=1 Tax=Ameca splendens TaxID=208324 RepID=A0ABV0XYF0_9TELE
MVEEAREGVCPGATADRHITTEGTSQLSPSQCLSRVQLEQDQAALLTSAISIYQMTGYESSAAIPRTGLDKASFLHIQSREAASTLTLQ